MEVTVSNPALNTGHVALNVTDLNRSDEFYQALFDFDVLAPSDDDRAWALLGNKGVLSIALWQESDGQFASGLPGLHHLSFEVADVATVREAERTLKGLGVESFYDGIVAHGEGAPSGGVFFNDPDGVRLEIYATTGVDGHIAPVTGAPTCGSF
jgi:catechol 2,3-dioxygenase-like lactoylglutathione lyase family enzyme